eukprot:TRINITY_DN11637_c0_g1_i1.p1 TRINITY_DN11637_c0_g1~~TRINITY_DN11637_c0_g1_i1.p1  ORF type:complete len:933 (+),score=261.55 TRINITY_DN11637_c0_g1_i1:72-2870(+)
MFKRRRDKASKAPVYTKVQRIDTVISTGAPVPFDRAQHHLNVAKRCVSKASVLELQQKPAQAIDVYQRAEERLQSWIDCQPPAPLRTRHQQRVVREVQGKQRRCMQARQRLMIDHALQPAMYGKGAAEFEVLYYGEVPGLLQHDPATTRTDVINLVEDAKFEGLLPWKLGYSEEDLAVLTISMYGIKVSDQSLSEPPRLRLGYHEIASYDAIEEDLGVYWLVLRGGNPDDDDHFAWVMEVNDARILNEICQCIEHNIQESFRQRHPDADIRSSNPVDHSLSLLAQMPNMNRRSKAAMLMETAAQRNVTSSLIAPETVLDARAYRDKLTAALSEEDQEELLRKLRGYRNMHDPIGLEDFLRDSYTVFGEERVELLRDVHPFLNDEHQVPAATLLYKLDKVEPEPANVAEEEAFEASFIPPPPPMPPSLLPSKTASRAESTEPPMAAFAAYPGQESVRKRRHSKSKEFWDGNSNRTSFASDTEDTGATSSIPPPPPPMPAMLTPSPASSKPNSRPSSMLFNQRMKSFEEQDEPSPSPSPEPSPEPEPERRGTPPLLKRDSNANEDEDLTTLERILNKRKKKTDIAVSMGEAFKPRRNSNVTVKPASAMWGNALRKARTSIDNTNAAAAAAVPRSQSGIILPPEPTTLASHQSQPSSSIDARLASQRLLREQQQAAHQSAKTSQLDNVLNGRRAQLGLAPTPAPAPMAISTVPPPAPMASQTMSASARLATAASGQTQAAEPAFGVKNNRWMQQSRKVTTQASDLKQQMQASPGVTTLVTGQQAAPTKRFQGQNDTDTPEWRKMVRQRKADQQQQVIDAATAGPRAEAEHWAKIPEWKRPVLAKRQWQANKPQRRKAAEEAYWQSRQQALAASGIAAFQVEIELKREKQEVKSGRRRLPPEVLDPDLVTAPPPQMQATTTATPAHGVVLAPPPIV